MDNRMDVPTDVPVWMMRKNQTHMPITMMTMMIYDDDDDDDDDDDNDRPFYH